MWLSFYHERVSRRLNVWERVTCFGENTEKYINFTVPVEKEVTRIDKNGEEITKTICYILQFIDSQKLMAR